MPLPPEHIIRAVNETMHWACVVCRNETYREDASSIQKVYQLMDAIHEVPRMVLDWEHHDLREIRTHLGCFHSEQLPDGPDLVSYFDGLLSDLEDAS